MNSVYIRVYADAPHAANDVLSSQLGSVILSADKTNGCHIIDFASNKSDHVVRFIMGGDTYVFVDAFHSTFPVSADLKETFTKNCQ